MLRPQAYRSALVWWAYDFFFFGIGFFNITELLQFKGDVLGLGDDVAPL